MLSRRKVEIITARAHEQQPVRIVGDATIATGVVGDGRMMPVLILDIAQRPDITDYIRMHRDLTGDVVVRWGSLPEHDVEVALILSFVRPLEMTLLIAFDLEAQQGALVELILQSGGMYIQAGRDGDRLGTSFNKERVIIQVPDTGFRRYWDKIYFKFTVKKMRQLGLDRSKAKIAAREAIATMREIGDFRIPRR